MTRRAIVCGTTLLVAIVCGCQKPHPKEEPAPKPVTQSGTLEPDYYASQPLDQPSTGKSVGSTAISGTLPPPPAEPSAPRTHTVVKGDTLYKLARQYYNDQGRWKDIFEANRDVLKKPTDLKAGQQLTIP